jgi:dihydropteroate synthase
MKTYSLSWHHHLEFGRRTCIMGILNVTPDSFSDGGKFNRLGDAVAHAVQMVADGADIIDIGGESTRPFAEPVSVEEEIRRVVPVIESLAGHVSVPISIDTTKAAVAERALAAGASIINDISALSYDPAMGELAARAGVPVVLMHMQGTPATMQLNPEYEDPVNDIIRFLENAVQQAEEQGIPRSRIIVDPGIGFGKTVEHNLLVIKHLKNFESLDVPVLIGPSRKSFLQKIIAGKVGIRNDADLAVTDIGTQAVVAAAVLNGAHIVRVHDVAGTRATVKIIDAIKQL